MAIEITCGCGAAYRLDDSRAGQPFACKVCHAHMNIPGAPRVILRAPTLPPPPPVEATAPAAAQQAAEAQAGVGVPTAGQGPLWSPSGLTVKLAPAPPPPPPPPPPPNPDLGGQAVARIRGFEPGGLNGPVTPTVRTPTAAPTADIKVPPAGPRVPPAAWWVVRGVMLAVCVAVLFAPWFTVAYPDPAGGGIAEESLSAWKIVTGLAKALSGGAGSSSGGGSPGGPGNPFESMSLPEGAAKAAAGVLLMGIGPCVYMLGLVLAAIFAYVAYKHEGAGAVWPFVAFSVGVSMFIIGWLMLASWEPLQAALAMASQFGASIGVSPWLYLIWFLIGAMAVIARGRPDFDLEEAARIYAE